MRRLWLILAWLMALAGAAQGHEITFSHVDVRLAADQTQVSVQLPIKGLLQQQPSVLPPGTADAALRGDTLPNDVQAALSRLVSDRLDLRSGGQRLALGVSEVRRAGEDEAVMLRAAPVGGALSVSADLFPDDPVHKVFVSVWRGETLAGQYVLDHQDPAFELAGPSRPLGEVILTFVGQGIHHIFIGPDHILFVLALILLGGRLATQLKIITAFTVAHSITLTLATLNIVSLPSRLVESVIAVSIVVVGLHDLWRLKRGGPAPAGPDPRMALAFVFGLVHGFGFASVLTALDLPKEALAWSLASFNIGVEIGQAAIVCLAAPLLIALGRYAPPKLARGVLTAAACVVVLAGGYWLFQRALGA